MAQEDTATERQEERQALLERSQAYIQRLTLRRPDGEREEFKLIERPLLVFGDPTRANENGTLWTWGEKGRPVAFLELYQFSGVKDRWVHAVTLTAAYRAVLKNEGIEWHPETTHIEPTSMPGSKPPSAKEDLRLRQMKEFARRFTAHEFWDPNNSRFELRLLEQPLCRFTDPAGGIQDGAAFALANGTNPEIILLIEALGKTIDDARWHYSLARLGSAEMHAEIDGKEVWKCDVAGAGRFGLPTEPYWAFSSPNAEQP